MATRRRELIRLRVGNRVWVLGECFRSGSLPVSRIHTHKVTNTCNRLFPPDSKRPMSVPSSLNLVHLPQFIFPCQGILIGGNLS
jgi:hypothetical protein